MSVANPIHHQLLKNAGIVVVSIATFLLVWQLGSIGVGRNLPSPIETVTMMLQLVNEPGPYGRTGLNDLLISLQRVAIILGVAMAISIVAGVLMGFSDPFREVMSAWLPLWMTLPDVVVILIAMVILGFEGQTIIIAVIFGVVPFGILNIWSGITEIDDQLLEMADSFGAGSRLRWQHIYIPYLFPYIFSSARYMIGLSWKIVLVGEAIGTNSGLGSMIRFWFNQGEVTPILAYLLLFVGVMLLLEYGVFKLLERRVFAWRNHDQ